MPGAACLFTRPIRNLSADGLALRRFIRLIRLIHGVVLSIQLKSSIGLNCSYRVWKAERGRA